MNKYQFIIVAGLFLLIMNIWSADFLIDKINYWAISSNILLVILGIKELRKKNNENRRI